MDFVERKTKPESTRKFLISQVEEQSNCCDVIITVGKWEKGFHRCVLLKSPFFDCLFKNEYRENQTGNIEIRLGTPLTVEMALMYLYGKRPKLTTDNIETMMALAEFFLIPSLKAVCVSWLKDEPVSEDNYFTLLQVASTYDIELPKCTEYIEGRLKVLLEKDEFLKIDRESVAYILDDKKFSYVTMDEKLKFLISWTNLENMNRKEICVDLLEYIDFRENSPEFLKEIESDSIFTDSVVKQKIEQAKLQEHEKHDVILIQKDAYSGMLWCLDLQREKWFQIKPNALIDHRDAKLKGVLNTEGLIYFIDKYKGKKVLCFDLESDTCKNLPVVEMGNNASYTGYQHIAVVEDICIVSETNTVTTNKRKENNRPYLHNHLALMAMAGMSNIEQMLFLASLQSKTGHTATVSTVKIGCIRNEQIEIRPLFTITGEKVSEICLNKKAILFLTESANLIVYDIDQSKLETVTEKASYSEKLAACEDGFVVYNNNRCICLQRLNGPALLNLYSVKLCYFKTECSAHDIRVYFCSNRWCRYYYRDYREGYRFEWATHEELLTAEKKEVSWTSLPPPPTQYSGTIQDNLFHVRLSRDRLQCDIDCPHCIAKERSYRSIQKRNADVADYYDDSSDDDVYVGYVYESL